MTVLRVPPRCRAGREFARRSRQRLVAHKMYTHCGNDLPTSLLRDATLVTAWQVPYFWIYADVLGNESRNKGGRGEVILTLVEWKDKNAEMVLANNDCFSRDIESSLFNVSVIRYLLSRRRDLCKSELVRS